MAKSKQDSSGTSRLLVPAEEAKALLEERVAKGRDLLGTSIRSFDELNNERSRYFKWDKYNTQLLQNMFSDGSVSDEYSYWGAFVVGGAPNLQADITEHIEDVNKKIDRLESLIDRLPLFKFEVSGEVVSSIKPGDVAIDKKKVFIIHGHDETRLLELEKILKDDFHLDPIILKDKPNGGSTTIIEKFELYASDCGFAIALFTPYPNGELHHCGMNKVSYA
jgi:hypothetical protein